MKIIKSKLQTNPITSQAELEITLTMPLSTENITIENQNEYIGKLFLEAMQKYKTQK